MLVPSFISVLSTYVSHSFRSILLLVFVLLIFNFSFPSLYISFLRFHLYIKLLHSNLFPAFQFILNLIQSSSSSFLPFPLFTCSCSFLASPSFSSCSSFLPFIIAHFLCTFTCVPEIFRVASSCVLSLSPLLLILSFPVRDYLSYLFFPFYFLSPFISLSQLF